MKRGKNNQKIVAITNMSKTEHANDKPINWKEFLSEEVKTETTTVVASKRQGGKTGLIKDVMRNARKECCYMDVNIVSKCKK